MSGIDSNNLLGHSTEVFARTVRTEVDRQNSNALGRQIDETIQAWSDDADQLKAKNKVIQYENDALRQKIESMRKQTSNRVVPSMEQGQSLPAPWP